MKDYFRQRVAESVEIMLRDEVSGHVFDLDRMGKYVVIISVVPKESIAHLELQLTPSAPLNRSDKTPGRPETKNAQ